MENRNVRKSKKAIQKAFAELLSEKNDINKITVKEIVERADISKSTFYSHYEDIYSVSEEFEAEITTLLNSLLEDYLKSHTLDYPTYIKKLIELLKRNEDLYKKIFLSDLPLRFISNLKDKCNEVISKDVHINFLSNGIEYLSYICLKFSVFIFIKGSLGTAGVKWPPRKNSTLFWVLLFV